MKTHSSARGAGRHDTRHTAGVVTDQTRWREGSFNDSLENSKQQVSSAVRTHCTQAGLKPRILLPQICSSTYSGGKIPSSRSVWATELVQVQHDWSSNSEDNKVHHHSLWPYHSEYTQPVNSTGPCPQLLQRTKPWPTSCLKQQTSIEKV